MDLDVDIKRKATVRLSKKDLLKLLAENEQMAEQITALQTRMTELVEENRRLKRQVLDPPDLENAPEDWGPGPGRSPDPNSPLPDLEPTDPHDIDSHATTSRHNIFNPNIYFDGSNGLGSGRRFGSKD